MIAATARAIPSAEICLRNCVVWWGFSGGDFSAVVCVVLSARAARAGYVIIFIGPLCNDGAC